MTLAPNEVFVFGANANGFHGAGSAGYAFRGTHYNTWRTDVQFLKAKEEDTKRRMGQPYDAQAVIGKWAVYGLVGLMEGRDGKSYGVVTTERPGYQGIVNDEYLLGEIQGLITTTTHFPDLIFRCTDFGLKRPQGFSWWSEEELRTIWGKAFADAERPTNLVVPTYLK